MNEICLSLIQGAQAKFYRLIHPAGSREVCSERGRIRERVTVKWDSFESEEQAAAFVAKLERQKRRKGYQDARPDDVLPANYHLYGVKRQKPNPRPRPARPKAKGKKGPVSGQLSLGLG